MFRCDFDSVQTKKQINKQTNKQTWLLNNSLGAIVWLLYSREQKHVSISDTPMLLIEINSISNMGCQK